MESPVFHQCDAHPAGLYAHTALPDFRCRLPGVRDNKGRAAVIAEFEANGFVAFEHAFTPAEVAAQQQGMSDLVDGSAESFTAALQTEYQKLQKTGRLPDFTSGAKIPWLQYEAGTNVAAMELSAALAPKARKIMGFIGYDARIDATQSNPKLLQLVAAILGCDVEEMDMFQDMALLKPAGGGREKPWHQVRTEFISKCVGLRVPCLEFYWRGGFTA